MSEIFCPALREVVTETPYYTGQAAAYLEKGGARVLDLYREHSDAIWDSFPGQVYTNVTNTLTGIYSRVAPIQLINGVRGGIANRMQGRAIWGAAVIGAGYALLEGAGDRFAEAMPMVYRHIQNVGHLATRGAEGGMWLLNGAMQIIAYPTKLMGKAGFVGAKAIYYGVQSKLFLIPVTTYLISRPTYKILCQEYEKKVRQDKNTISLDLITRFSEGYQSVKKVPTQKREVVKGKNHLLINVSEINKRLLSIVNNQTAMRCTLENQTTAHCTLEK